MTAAITHLSQSEKEKYSAYCCINHLSFQIKTILFCFGFWDCVWLPGAKGSTTCAYFTKAFILHPPSILHLNHSKVFNISRMKNIILQPMNDFSSAQMWEYSQHCAPPHPFLDGFINLTPIKVCTETLCLAVNLYHVCGPALGHRRGRERTARCTACLLCQLLSFLTMQAGQNWFPFSFQLSKSH